MRSRHSFVARILRGSARWEMKWRPQCAQEPSQCRVHVLAPSYAFGASERTHDLKMVPQLDPWPKYCFARFCARTLAARPR
eukprot:4238471-Alexandrium_andersonii.AAC.1